MDLAFGWLDEALSTLGAGAKTAAGYGCFEHIETIEIPKIEKRQQVKTPEPVQSLSAIRQEMEQDGYSDGNQQKFMSCLAKWLDRMDSSEASPEDRSEIANHLAEWYRANKLSDWENTKKRTWKKSQGSKGIGTQIRHSRAGANREDKGWESAILCLSIDGATRTMEMTLR